MKRKSLLMTGLILGSFAFSGMAFAAENEEVPTYSFDPMVVTATRTERAVVDTPANVQVFTQKDIKEKGYQSTFELVRNAAQANAHSYQEDGDDYGGMISRVRVRGIDNGTLVLINGNPANFNNSAVLTSVPVDQIERVEVVKGASSVLYGPQAMGGVINIITKKVEKNGEVHGNISVATGNYKTEGAINLRTDYVNLGYKMAGFRDHNNAVYPGITGGEGKAAAFDIVDKKGYQFYADVALAKDLTFSYSRVENKSSYISGNFKNWQAIMDKRANYITRYNNYGLNYDNKDNGWKVSLGMNKLYKDNVYDKTYPKKYSDSWYDGYDANIDVQKTFRLNSKKDTLVVGVDIQREKMEALSGTKLNTNGRNAQSLFQSWNIHPTDRLEFILGLREYWLGKSRYQNSDFQWLPQVQGRYKLDDQSNVYFNVGKSFEMPSVQSGFSYDTGSGSGYLVNPDLKPQVGWSYEVGYKKETDKSSLGVDVFYMTVKDKLFWDKLYHADGSYDNIMRNRDEWKNYGVEVNYKRKFSDKWDVDLGVTAQNPVATSSGVDSQDTSKFILNVGAGYKVGKFAANTRVFSYLARELCYYNRQHTGTKPKDHHLKNTCDLTISLSYNPTKEDTFRITGRNLLDRKDMLTNYEYLVRPANFVVSYERSF